MTRIVRRDLPADITVFAGEFASQPLVFAHLLDSAPSLDLDHVEVIQGQPGPRLAARFSSGTATHIRGLGEGWNTLVLILPAAYPGLECPVRATRHLLPLGQFRGTVPHVTVAP